MLHSISWIFEGTYCANGFPVLFGSVSDFLPNQVPDFIWSCGPSPPAPSSRASFHSLSGSRSWSFPLWCLLECPPGPAPTSHLSWRFPSVQSIILCGGRLSLISTLSQFHWLGSLSFIILIEIRIKQRSITMTILLRVFAQVKDCKVSVHSDHHCKFRVWESYCVEWLESQSILVLSKNQWLSLWGSRALYHFNYIFLHRNWLSPQTNFNLSHYGWFVSINIYSHIQKYSDWIDNQ